MLENLFDDTVEEVARMPEQPPWPEAEPVPTICCVPGRNELDAATALLLVYVLRFEGSVRKTTGVFCRPAAFWCRLSGALRASGARLPIADAHEHAISCSAFGAARRARKCWSG